MTLFDNRLLQRGNETYLASDEHPQSFTKYRKKERLANTVCGLLALAGCNVYVLTANAVVWAARGLCLCTTVSQTGDRESGVGTRESDDLGKFGSCFSGGRRNCFIDLSKSQFSGYYMRVLFRICWKLNRTETQGGRRSARHRTPLRYVCWSIHYPHLCS